VQFIAGKKVNMMMAVLDVPQIIRV